MSLSELFAAAREVDCHNPIDRSRSKDPVYDKPDLVEESESAGEGSICLRGSIHIHFGNEFATLESIDVKSNAPVILIDRHEEGES
jgi:hypothetical protein